MAEQTRRERTARAMFVADHHELSWDAGEYWDEPKLSDEFKQTWLARADAAIAAADAGKPSKEEFGKALEDMLNKHRWLITTQSRDPYRQQYSDDFDAARREVLRLAGYGEEG